MAPPRGFHERLMAEVSTNLGVEGQKIGPANPARNGPFCIQNNESDSDATKVDMTSALCKKLLELCNSY